MEVKAGEKAGTQLVIVKGTEKGLKKEDGVKALGDKAARFIVKEWKVADAKEEKKGS